MRRIGCQRGRPARGPIQDSHQDIVACRSDDDIAMPGLQAAVHHAKVAGEDGAAGQGVRGAAHQERGVGVRDEAGLEVDAALGAIGGSGVES